MIIPDINLLIYAYHAGSKHHRPARLWWGKCLEQPETIGLPWVAILGFIRLTTHQRVFSEPMAVEEATANVRAWLARPQVQIIEPGARHADILFAYLADLGTAGNLTTDAHLAAIAVEHQAVLFTVDHDFKRFRGLRWRDPLAGS